MLKQESRSIRGFGALSVLLLFSLAGCGEDALEGIFDVCQPGVIPDEACYVQKRDPSSAQVAQALDIALGYISRHPPEKMAWDWGDGVLMFSLAELYRITRDTRLRDYYKAWLDAHIKKGYEIVWSDSCPPALAALSLAGEGAAYQKIVDDVVAYFRTAPRTDEGGISHMGRRIPMIKTLWLDSLFMVGMPIIRQGERASDQVLLDSIGGQFRIFSQVLQGAGGFYSHAHGWPGEQKGVYWGRGNGWVTAAGHEYLRAQRLRGHPDAAVSEALHRQAQAIIRLQDAKTGLWWTVLDRPGESYLETSASALFTYGLARGYRYGQRGGEVLPVIKRALSGIQGAITKSAGKGPVVTGISGPTMVGSFSYYAVIKQESDLHFGVGAVILALVETSGLPSGP